MTITTPIDGTIQSSSINTVGKAVTTGAELMRIVPDNSALEAEAYIPNSDIGFVSVRQPAVVKIEAFPFTRYGVIHGRVTAVATDAIPEPDAHQLDSSVMNVDGNSKRCLPAWRRRRRSRPADGGSSNICSRRSSRSRRRPCRSGESNPLVSESNCSSVEATLQYWR
nr:HlyD family efflux transporter periplasmic adaptor subunit [Rhizobium sp. RCAM05973]